MWVFGGVPHQLLPVEQASSVLVEISEQSPPSGRVAACGGMVSGAKVGCRHGLGGGFTEFACGFRPALSRRPFSSTCSECSSSPTMERKALPAVAVAHPPQLL